MDKPMKTLFERMSEVARQDAPPPEDKSMNKDGVTDAMLNAGQERMCELRNVTFFDDELQAEIYLAMIHASPTVSTDGLVERLRELRVVLKSGDYDGADLMRAWCAMMDAADRIEQLTATLADRDATIERMREALKLARRYVANVVEAEEFEINKRELSAIDAALDASATVAETPTT